MADIMGYFRILIIVQLFYSFGISAVTYGMPADTRQNYVVAYSDLAGEIDLDSTASEIQDSLTAQTNLPLIDVGALVFYSGNFLMDLLLNFAFAVPQMLSLLINSITFIFNIDAYYINLLQLFTSVAMMAIYFISIMQLVTGIRSGRIV